MSPLTGIIAECGNHHFGDLGKAKELIRTAKDCGASYCKFQAIDPDWFTGGSMPPEFYQQCDLGLDGYQVCEEYGRALGIPVFFSVFGPKYRVLTHRHRGVPYKISGSQFLSSTKAELQAWNDQTEHPVIISIPEVENDVLLEKKDAVTNMNIMYVTPYLPEDVSFDCLDRYGEVFGRRVGYSDHTPGIADCCTAIGTYGADLVEKHFNVYGVQNFKGAVYRDSLHAASAKDLERLVKFYEHAQ